MMFHWIGIEAATGNPLAGCGCDEFANRQIIAVPSRPEVHQRELVTLHEVIERSCGHYHHLRQVTRYLGVSYPIIRGFCPASVSVTACDTTTEYNGRILK